MENLIKYDHQNNKIAVRQIKKIFAATIEKYVIIIKEKFKSANNTNM